MTIGSIGGDGGEGGHIGAVLDHSFYIITDLLRFTSAFVSDSQSEEQKYNAKYKY